MGNIWDAVGLIKKLTEAYCKGLKRRCDAMGEHGETPPFGRVSEPLYR